MQNESIHMEADHDNIRDIVEPPYMEKVLSFDPML